MNKSIGSVFIFLIFVLSACGPDEVTTTDDTGRPAYVTLDAGLTQLKADFNAMTDKIRLVFISGPSCGICLRGMDDLNEAIVASIQIDPRVHTLVLQVPTLGAEEKHAAAAVPLMPGPRVNHYWDPEGNSGVEFMKPLGIDVYAWDVWMVYEPGARWEEGAHPPPPAFWQHQLGSLPQGSRLDAEKFAAVVREMLADMRDVTEESRVAAAQQTDPGILSVAQPLGVMIRSNHESRGGYHELKKIQSIRYVGETDIDGQTYSLHVTTERPHRYERAITNGPDSSTIEFDGANIVHSGDGPTPLPVPIQNDFLASYEFDGWMTDWKEKGHNAVRLGMKKHGNRLPWLVEAELTNGRTWHVYVDSHTGDAFRVELVDDAGGPSIAIEYDDYREVDGTRLPYEARYFDGDRLLAADRYTDISVIVER
jgi:hypothetical protein